MKKELENKLREVGYTGKTDLETLLEALPKAHNLMSDYSWYLNIWFFRNSLAIGYVCEDDPHPNYVLNSKENESLADTASRLLVKLIEERIIEVNNEPS